jgi:predicted anti-sigma-YlaC factor YlaD
MSDPKATLARLLDLTRSEEIDCDAFAEHLAALVEGKVEPKLAALLDHHRKLCPECDEELNALARALEVEPLG